jgi:fructose-1,6-bisphosphatase
MHPDFYELYCARWYSTMWTRRLFASYSVLFIFVQWYWQNGFASYSTTMAFTYVLPSSWYGRRRSRRAFYSLQRPNYGKAFVNKQTLGIHRRREDHDDSSLGMVLNQLDPVDRGTHAIDLSLDDSSVQPQVSSPTMIPEDASIRRDNYGTTLTRFVEEQKVVNPDFAALEPLMSSIAIACRIISLNLIHRAPFITNSLEHLCSQVMQQALLYTGQCHVTTIVSTTNETSPSLLRVETLDATKYVAFISPLMRDASFTQSNDDMLLCGSGTLFSIYRCSGSSSSLWKEQPLLSGYCLYGSSTQLVVATTLVQGFTLSIHNQNEFMCTHPHRMVSTTPTTTVEHTIPPAVLQRLATASGHFHRHGAVEPDWVEEPWIRGVGPVHRALGATGGILSLPRLALEQVAALAFLWELAGGSGLYVAASDGRCYRSLAELPSTDGVAPWRACYFGTLSDLEQLESYLSTGRVSIAHSPDEA